MPPSRPVDGQLRDVLEQRPLPDDARVDKHARGTVLVVGGSSQTPGAVLLAGRAALRVGAGRLQIATVSDVVAQLAVAVPEAMVLGLDELGSSITDADALVVGPGFGDAELAVAVTRRVLTCAAPDALIVLDAMAIDALSSLSEAAGSRRGHLVLTPNRTELERLVRADDLPSALHAAARRHGAAICCFDYVADATGALWRDDDDAVGLGTSGAGDVLAGLAGGFAARSGDAFTAACWAAAVHRAAASRVADEIAPIGYLASELADAAPAALYSLQQRPSASDGRSDGPRTASAVVHG